VGASTRIEGSKMSDEDVAKLLNNIGISRLEDRDSQEVAGYFNVLETIVDSSDAIVKNDIAFRKIFGNETKKVILLS
jgi:hypothetical protein